VRRGLGQEIFGAHFSAADGDTTSVPDEILSIVSRAGAVVKFAGIACAGRPPFEDAETRELVDLTTISSEELQRISDEIIVLELSATDSGNRTARSLFTDDGNDEIDAEDPMVTIENERYFGDTDD
jgi:hypothetical protein